MIFKNMKKFLAHELLLNYCAKTRKGGYWLAHEKPTIKLIVKFLEPEKGKPLERVGRKATGLSFRFLTIWSQGCRADDLTTVVVHQEGSFANNTSLELISHGKVKLRGAIVLQTSYYLKIRRPKFSFLYPPSFILPVWEKIDLPQVPLLSKSQIGHFVYFKR